MEAAPTTPSLREMAMAEAARQILGLLRVVLALVQKGIRVIGFQGQRRNGIDRITIHVAPSPYLYMLFKDECERLRRRQEGYLTIHTWVAVRDGIRIEWEEVCAGGLH